MRTIKTRKQKERLYEENYGDIPKDYIERLQWMYDKYHLNINKAAQILQKRNAMLDIIRFCKEFFVVLYEEPEGSPRPRARYISKSNLISSSKEYPGFIQIYSLTGASDRKFMSRVIENSEFQELENHLIYTPCFVEYSTFTKTPSSYSTTDKFLAEMGLIRPLAKPDFDNIEKKYADMYNKNVWLDDELVVEATIRKYYSILPRVEISLHYLNMLYNKTQAIQLQKKLPDQEIKYFE